MGNLLLRCKSNRFNVQYTIVPKMFHDPENISFESRLCGRFFSRPIFLVIYGFIKSLYVSAFTYSHPVGMCVFSRFKNLSMLAMPRKSVSLKIGEGMGCYLVPLLSFAFARASVPFSRSFLVSFLLVLPRHTSLHRVSE